MTPDGLLRQQPWLRQIEAAVLALPPARRWVRKSNHSPVASMTAFVDNAWKPRSLLVVTLGETCRLGLALAGRVSLWLPRLLPVR